MPAVLLRAMLVVTLLLAAVALPGVTSASNDPGEALLLRVQFGGDPVPRWPEAWPEDGGMPLIAPVVQRASQPILESPLSVFANAQVVSLYGVPNVPEMGALGRYTPEGATREAARVAAEYDALNGDQQVIPALHLIVAIAQRWQTDDGSYLVRASRSSISEYVEATRAAGQLLFLDIQLGWADPLDEVQRLGWALSEEHVHLALDPEFATGASRAAPGTVIGSVDAEQVNLVQGYLAKLVRRDDLPPKVLVLHQFLDSMLVAVEDYQAVSEVEISVDMDGYGPDTVKITKYESYATGGYSERPAIKLFYDWDAPLITPERLQALALRPSLVIYQ